MTSENCADIRSEPVQTVYALQSRIASNVTEFNIFSPFSRSPLHLQVHFSAERRARLQSTLSAIEAMGCGIKPIGSRQPIGNRQPCRARALDLGLTEAIARLCSVKTLQSLRSLKNSERQRQHSANTLRLDAMSGFPRPGRVCPQLIKCDRHGTCQCCFADTKP